MPAKKKQDVEKVEQTVPTFTKKQLLKSTRYAKNVDVIQGLLKENKSYSKAEVDKIIEDFRNGKYQIN